MIERLQKYMASCGVASRRKCEQIILDAKVSVNDIIITELGVKVDSDKDIVKVNGKLIKPEENKVYIMLNKPEGYITSVSDEKNRQTILDIVKVKERIYPVGRLDYDSSGLLILTNDGEIYNKLIHPRVKMPKTYIVEVTGHFTDSQIKKFETGIDIGDYITSPAEIVVLENYSKGCLVKIVIREGKNRQIRRMCNELNHEVISLKRVSIGNLKLDDLKKGEYRSLTKEEIKYIMSL